MPPIELYIAEDNSIYRINRLTENPAFFTYQALSQEEINKLVQNNKRNQKKLALRGTTARHQERAQEPTPEVATTEAITYRSE